jgi:hypothetical protein
MPCVPILCKFTSLPSVQFRGRPPISFFHNLKKLNNRLHIYKPLIFKKIVVYFIHSWEIYIFNSGSSRSVMDQFCFLIYCKEALHIQCPILYIDLPLRHVNFNYKILYNSVPNFLCCNLFLFTLSLTSILMFWTLWDPYSETQIAL